MDNAWGPIGMFSAGQPGNKEQRLNVHGIFRYLYVLAAIVGPDGHFTHGQCERTVSPCMLVLFNPAVQEMQPLAPNVPSPLFFFVLRRMFFRGRWHPSSSPSKERQLEREVQDRHRRCSTFLLVVSPLVSTPSFDERRRSWRSSACLERQLRRPTCDSSTTRTCARFDSHAHLFFARVPRHVPFAVHRHPSEECVFGVFPTRASTRFDHGLVLSATTHGVSHLRGELRGASVRGRLFHVRLARLLLLHVARCGAQERRHRREARDDEAHRHRRRSSHVGSVRAEPGLLFEGGSIPFRTRTVSDQAIPFEWDGRGNNQAAAPRGGRDMVVDVAQLWCKPWRCMCCNTIASETMLRWMVSKPNHDEGQDHVENRRNKPRTNLPFLLPPGKKK